MGRNRPCRGYATYGRSLEPDLERPARPGEELLVAPEGRLRGVQPAQEVVGGGRAGRRAASRGVPVAAEIRRSRGGGPRSAAPCRGAR